MDILKEIEWMKEIAHMSPIQIEKFRKKIHGNSGSYLPLLDANEVNEWKLVYLMNRIEFIHAELLEEKKEDPVFYKIQRGKKEITISGKSLEECKRNHEKYYPSWDFIESY